MKMHKIVYIYKRNYRKSSTLCFRDKQPTTTKENENSTLISLVTTHYDLLFRVYSNY